MCPNKRLIYMGNGRQSHTKTSAAEQRVPANWRQHSPKVDTMTCNKINNITITIEATINECSTPTDKLVHPSAAIICIAMAVMHNEWYVEGSRFA